ncbi:threonylcarbamoyl-AMP synthase [Caldalkalibacillus thermarum]|uniref:L-threonylcarbamoyladenylate synthase n=1 Tax=Caldalkalibacillus thermarum TaxID=296745 RepID=UPI00166BA0D5|nr:L-threonylcarbamoyladenylate synthase [Caldalkalibacillus thermarum]GGK25865.1 threonylcarbamoyl-AMP synthase [Caldalkalibacillus thermarum]
MEHQWQTKYWDIHNIVDKDVDNLITHPHIQEAASWINRDEPVAFPTETVYGLGANALSDKAVQKIFAAKGRPADNPLIVHISCVDKLAGIVDKVPDKARILMEKFWPGPLTLVLPCGSQVSRIVTAGLDTVAVRMPAHPVALALIEACGKPLAAPSANRSGKPSPTRAEHVWHDLAGRIVGVLDGGETGIGLESTVVDVTGEVPVLLRPGGVTKGELEAVIGPVDVDPALKHSMELAHSPQTFRPRSPGMKYKHYAPDGEVFLVSLAKGIQEMRRFIQDCVNRDRQQGYTVAVLTTDDGLSCYSADLVLSLGDREELQTVAQRIYDALRQVDQARMQKIYIESFPPEAVGEAIMNRLHKAAQGRMLEPRPLSNSSSTH